MRCRSRSTRSSSRRRTSPRSSTTSGLSSGTLVGADRPAQNGDFVSIDLTAAVDGVDIPDAKTEGLSHEVGTGKLIDGLDEAIVGLAEGESKVFVTKLLAGEHAGEDADVTVTVKSIKVRELPEANDEFAQLATNSTRSPNCVPTSKSRCAESNGFTRPRRFATMLWKPCSSRWRCRFPRLSSGPYRQK